MLFKIPPFIYCRCRDFDVLQNSRFDMQKAKKTSVAKNFAKEVDKTTLS